NQDIIHELRDDIHVKFGIHPGINLIRGDAQVPALKEVDPTIYKEVINRLKDDRSLAKYRTIYQTIVDTREVLGQQLACETFISQSRSYACYAGSLMGIIYENGDVYPCEILKGSTFGNLRESNYDMKKIWESATADKIRRSIKRKECFCTYECQYTCNTVYNLRFSLRFINQILKRIIEERFYIR
ncbi:SPASM domain-containing protein, partial [Candidatus Auribacterota bacterium]